MKKLPCLRKLLIIFIFCSVDGGVSRNDFVCQLLSDMTSLTVERAESSEMSVLGAAYLAGLQAGRYKSLTSPRKCNYINVRFAGVWKSKEDLKELRKIDQEFNPDVKSTEINAEVMEQWRRVTSRFRNWYDFDITDVHDE